MTDLKFFRPLALLTFALVLTTGCHKKKSGIDPASLGPTNTSDSSSTTVRNYDMSSVAAAIANFAAQSLPCTAVAADFNRPAASRRSPPGRPAPAGAAAAPGPSGTGGPR